MAFKVSTNGQQSPNIASRAVEIGAVALAYFLAARLGLLLALHYKNISPVWPPSGVAMAALIAWRVRPWPGLAIGAFLANYSTGLPLQTSFVIAVGNTLEGLLCANLLRRSGWFDRRLSRMQDVLLL